MNYEDMSDLVIDRKVFVKIYGECIGDKDMHRVWQANKFRPCSNPSNAWPVIVENKINITYHSDGDACAEVFCESINDWISVACKNPLRAAMICFLKMKDAEQ